MISDTSSCFSRYEQRAIATALRAMERVMRDGGIRLDRPAAVVDYLQLKLGALEHEVFALLYLDAQNRLIAYEELFRGTVSQTAVYPREIVKRAGIPVTDYGFTTDAELKFARMDERVAARLGLDAKAIIGQPLTRHFQLSDGADGTMPLLTALASRQDFTGQRAKVRGSGETEVTLNGVALLAGKTGFAGYEIELELEGGVAGQAGPIFDPALDERVSDGRVEYVLVSASGH